MTKGVAMANKKLVNLLLQDENANVANDEFDTLSGSDWVCLLLKKPQFADKCDCCKISDALISGTTVSYWHKLTAKQWCDLLIKQPQLIKYCNTSIITEKGKAKLLAKHPDLAKYFLEAEKKVDNNQPELF